MCKEKRLRDVLDMPHHSRRRHLERAWIERFDAFPRRSHLHIPIDRSTPLLNRGAMSFLLPYHNHALFVVIELLSLMNIFRSLVACLMLRGAPWLPR